jgi:hypothetical protein
MAVVQSNISDLHSTRVYKPGSLNTVSVVFTEVVNLVG